MKKVLMVLMVLLLAGWRATAQVTPEQVIDAIGQMTPEQVDELNKKLAANYWEPIPEGFFSRFAFRIDATYNQFDDLQAGDLDLANGDLDIDDAGGMEIALLWQVVVPELHIGLKFGGSSDRDATSSAGGYSRIEMTDAYWAFLVNYQLVRQQHFILWLEGSGGFGSTSLETLNTPAGGASTFREFDGDYGMGDIRLGASWRFNPIISLHAAAGYRFAGEVDFEEGDRDTLLSMDPSGFVGTMGLGFSY